MNRQIKENLESLLEEVHGTKRLGRRIVNLAGYLGSDGIPDQISSQLAALSKLLVQQDAFEALLQPMTINARAQHAPIQDNSILIAVMSGLEEARKQLCAHEQINYSELIAWLVSKAEERKILKTKREV